MDVFRLAVLATASVVTTVSLGLAQAPPKADPQMQAVLDQLGKLLAAAG